ncbi:MAG: amylo-alpha-1,6-glucosidase [Cellulosilyticaceae bacterium]
MGYQFGRNAFRTIEEGLEREWVLGNGIGGFAGGTIIGANSRAHHSYLVAALNPPVDRLSILGKTQESIQIGKVVHDLASQQYINWHKDGQKYLQRFTLEGVPTYHYQVQDVSIKKTVAIEYGKNTVVVCYEVTNGIEEAVLSVTPLFSCKDLGSSLERSELQFDTALDGKVLTLVHRDHPELPITCYTSCGDYYDRKNIPTSMATPNYLIEENLVYAIDNRNGALGVDNYLTPYQIDVKLQPFEKKSFYMKCTVEQLDDKTGFEIVEAYKARMERLKECAGSQAPLVQKLAQAADHFIVKRNSTGLKTILAGLPWFTDWGRDTMIALQGLTLCTKRFDDAREILESFSKYVKNGLIPNVFPNHEGDEPGYNTVDGSMWYFYSVDRYLHYTGGEAEAIFIKEKIYPSLKAIIEAYQKGTDFSIKMDTDGLIMAGSDLDQITWMDVRVGDWVVTPRHGKPVEINALWYNALKVMEKLSERFGEDGTTYSLLAKQVKQSFNEKFWNEETQCLYDVVDANDGKIRPNQIWATFLPYTMMDEEKELKVVQTVYKHLYTPYGLRSLSDQDEAYQAQYIGKLIQRDAAYHMGTTWAFPIGAFISSYCKVHKHSEEAVQVAKEMCEVFEDHMNDGCIGGIAEIFDGTFPCTSRGCYTQAWSVGEVLRAYVEDVLPYLK